MSLQIDRQRRTNSKLNEALDENNNDETVKSIFRKELGLAAEGEILFYDVSN